MSLLLHAITTHPEAAPRDATVRCVHVVDLTAWYSDIRKAASTFTRADVLSAHRTVTDVFAQVAACLPARFPTLVSDEAALRALLDDRRGEWTPRLERVRDACELAVTAVWRPREQESTPTVTAATPGRRYLLERQQALTGSARLHARATELADELERDLGARVISASRQVCPSPAVALSLALLVPRAHAAAALQRLPRAADDVRILLNGPWPPYTFAGLGLEQGDAR